jgi:ribosomal protein S3
MPLKSGYSAKTIGRNIAEQMQSGVKRRQAVAAALRSAKDSEKKSGARGKP